MTVRRIALALLLPAALTIGCSDDAGNGAPTESSALPGGSEPSYARGAHPELPGLGHKFRLLFAMMDNQDPQNPTNDVVSVLTTPATIGVALRDLPPGIKISAFDTQLGFKYYFVNRSCGGGSPRVTLRVDADGDGDFDTDPPTGPGDPDDSPDFAVHGHPNPFVGCPANEWVYENLTDPALRWEVTPGGSVEGIPVFPFVNWDVLEAAVTTLFPDHQVLTGSLVDDSCSFFAASCGQAYYDLVTVENRTLENDQDTVEDQGT
jgi:hypothetical protein